MAMGNVLVLRLKKKGLSPVEISRLIKDSFNLIQKEQISDRELVNGKLERLGWGTQILDEITYDLMIYCFETNEDIMQYIPEFVPWVHHISEGIRTHE